VKKYAVGELVVWTGRSVAASVYSKLSDTVAQASDITRVRPGDVGRVVKDLEYSVIARFDRLPKLLIGLDKHRIKPHTVQLELPLEVT
jgi:hypothetical protein